jgi:hypothetical protein
VDFQRQLFQNALTVDDIPFDMIECHRVCGEEKGIIDSGPLALFLGKRPCLVHPADCVHDVQHELRLDYWMADDLRYDLVANVREAGAVRSRDVEWAKCESLHNVIHVIIE